jgi:D-glycero-alpha-D-manno-heptose-7-phosphate kinase
MIVVRAPLRVSFIGGGSDFPQFFNREPGYVLGTAINLFVYTAIVKHSNLADNKFKVSYRIIESVDKVDEIKHPLVRSALLEYGFENVGLHISTLADVPASTGLGSSSAFAVSLIKALSIYKNMEMTPKTLALAAIRLEREILQESGGWQDQCHSSFGGMNLFQFSNNDFSVSRSFQNSRFIDFLNQKMILVSFGKSRNSYFYANKTQSNLMGKDGKMYAREIADLAKDVSDSIVKSPNSTSAYNSLVDGINLGWKLKRTLHDIDMPELELLIQKGFQNGARAAKLCGAGGSGFILFLLDNQTKEDFIQKLNFQTYQNISVWTQGIDVGPLNWT